MAANKVNWPVVVMLLTCYVIAFALAIAAEQHRAQVIISSSTIFLTRTLTQIEHHDNVLGICSSCGQTIPELISSISLSPVTCVSTQGDWIGRDDDEV